MKTKFLSFLVLTVILSTITVSTQTVNWVQYLKSQTPPPFRQGHTLYPLTFFGFGSDLRDYPTTSELATNWGFALEFSDAPNVNPADTNKIKTILNDPNSYEYKLIQLAKSNPTKYKLHLPAFQFRNQGMIPFTQAECPDCYSRDSEGNVIVELNVPTLNPLMSEELITRIGERYAWPFKYIERQFGVKVGMGIHQGEAAHWSWDKDPVVVADRGSEDKNIYRDKKFARIIKGFFTPIQTSLKDDGLFVYYSNGGHWDKGRFGGAVNGVPYYVEHTIDATVLPNVEHYWGSFNGRGACDNFPTQTFSFLTKYLASTGQEIALGRPFSYEWTSPYWGTDISGLNAPMDTWTGALKCMYVGGMLGSNIGFYGSDAIYPATFNAAAPPLHVAQTQASARVHALFSWIEPFVRNSDLLPGPHMHAYTSLPAYEFLKQMNDNGTSNPANCGSRVMARKHKTNNEWLISAWNSNGVDRDVTVNIPVLGDVTLRLRKTGTLYYARLTGATQELTMLDTDGIVNTIDTTLLKSKYGHMYSTPNVAVSGVTVSPATATIASVGNTLDLKAIVTPADVINKFVTWTTSNKNIAWVSPSGVVTAVTPGTVTITATTFNGKLSASSTITVDNQPVSVKGISMLPLFSGMDLNDKLQLVVKVAPENAANKNATWSSNNPSVATVSNTGVVNALSVGNAEITATSVDGGKTAKTSIMVTPYSGGDGLRGFYYSNTTLSSVPVASRVDTVINFNWTATPLVTPFPSINRNKFSAVWAGQIQPIFSEDYTFETYSDDGVRLWVNNILIIDNWQLNTTGSTKRGTISLKAGVKYNIVMQYFQDGHSSTIKLSWSSDSQAKEIIRKSRLFSAAQFVPVTALSILPATASVDVNASLQLESLITPSNATNRNVNWTSTNTSVAGVSTSGLVRGISAGTALIIASIGDGSLKDTTVLTVNKKVSTSSSIFTNQIPELYGNEGDFEFGMKFQSTNNGYITKIRYYKTEGEQGTHTGRIWNTSGKQLASVVFTGESAIGWQEMALATPLAIIAGTTYIVSVNSNLTFAQTPYGLVSAIENGYLKALSGVNGVYHPTPGSFPNQSVNSTNYFRDVVFELSLTSGVNGTKSNNEVLIYPNPTNGVVHIKAPERSKIEILDMMGRKIYTGITNAFVETIDLSGQHGLFLIRVGNEVTHKLIVK